MASPEKPVKRSLEDAVAANDSPSKRTKGSEAPDAADALEQQTGSLRAPSVEQHIEVAALLPALQQLLSAYKVEYWAALEELRARQHSFCEAGRQLTQSTAAVEASKTNSQTLAAASKGSLQQIAQALLPQQQQQDAEAATQPPQDTQAQQQKQEASYGDDRCGYGSTSEQLQLPTPSAVQQLLLQLPRGTDQGCATAEQLQQWHERFKSASAAMAGLEQLASAATLQLMDSQGALACLCGSSGRWMIRRTAVSIGRSSDTKGDVDVDLSRALAPNAAAASHGANTPGAAAATAGATPGGNSSIVIAPETQGDLKKVSRLQAQLSLELDGSWTLRNTGRAGLVVNGAKVARGSKVAVPHLSLLEIGGEPLLFMVNGLAVQRAVARTSQLVM